MSDMSRGITGVDIDLTDALATTGVIPVGGLNLARVIVPTGSSVTSLTFYSAATEDGTYQPCYTTAGVAITQTVAAARDYELPAGLYGVRHVKAVANVAGTVHFLLKA